jgi:NADPH:quinone reductase-like Zn-dependent oxidoreductase
MKKRESYVDLCTVPVAFATVVYTLKHLARLRKNETVLIHSAAGGVGIVALQVAASIGAKIFATVGNEKKALYDSFVNDVLKATNGRGVDVVLNSLAGELLHQSLGICAKFGRFIEIGKRDILGHGNLNMRKLEHNITFFAVDLADFYYSDNPAHAEQFAEWVFFLPLLRKYVNITSVCSPNRWRLIENWAHQSLRYLIFLS